MSFVTYVLGVDPIIADIKKGNHASARNRLCDKLQEWVGAKQYDKLLPFILALRSIPFTNKEDN
jgi:hypothetical protein